MDVRLPIYVEACKRDGNTLCYRCRPLFHNEPFVLDENLRRATNKLARELKVHLDLLGRSSLHHALADYLFAPEVRTQRLKLQLDLRDRLAKCTFLFVRLRAWGREIAFTPGIPDLWFELGPNETLKARATETLVKYFRELSKQSDAAPPPEDLALSGEAWVSDLELDVATRQRTEAEQERRHAALWDDTQLDGATELRRVGRCLDWLYPDDLDRAVGRDAEVDELQRLLDSPDQRPLMLVGPPLTGKTTVLHEVVYRRVLRRRKPQATRRNVWLIAPQRLISGMSFVGQWENRLLAILRYARQRRHVLYFDDLLGLYQAGQSRSSSLCVADVLKPYVQDRHVRVVAELTDEAFHALAEQDRGFADMFHVIRVEETNDEQTLRTLLAVRRQLEAQYRCSFDIDVLPAVIELHRRYLREQRFPGKAARFMRQLAVKHRRSQVARQTVFAEFSGKTGFSVSLLDTRERLRREDVLAELRGRIISQDQALQAAADVVCVAKARMNDPDRPLATMIFMGPTGVGKTQCVKTLAAYLFGSEDQVLRFDMNEYVEPYAVARLVGTRDEPEGLLTAAVRQRPYSVILLDEIEKAHRDVFDLLLQVIGEGRLTDALGRTADFTGTIIVMTSNLGVREAARTVGFASEQHKRLFLRAAEQFFRPEFLNRVDRVIPFHSLSREDVARVARLLIDQVFSREGLQRRRCVLHVDPRALERVIDQGFQPQLGARVLRRAIEQQLTQPVAKRLAAFSPELPSVISLLPGNSGIRVYVQELRDSELVQRGHRALPPAELLSSCSSLIARIEQQIQADRPPGSFSFDTLTPPQLRYFAIAEQIERVRALAVQLRERIELDRDPFQPPSLAPQTGRSASRSQRFFCGPTRRILKELVAAEDITAYLKDLLATGEAGAGDATQLSQEAAVLAAMADSKMQLDRAVLLVRPVSAAGRRDANSLASQLAELFDGEYGFHCEQFFSAGTTQQGFSIERGEPTHEFEMRFLAIAGPFAELFALPEVGVHLVHQPAGTLMPIQVASLAIIRAAEQWRTRPAEFERDIRRFLELREKWINGPVDEDGDTDDDPCPLGQVIRIHDERSQSLVDLRSGLSVQSALDSTTLRSLAAASFTLPQELRLQANE